ncbi:MAG: putative nucleotidyltransferase [Candidatus Woesearchaeota archaeon]|jgi:predicted nucleotidyltransferase
MGADHNTMVRLELIQILKHLITHSEKEFTIRELSIVRDINYKSAYEAIEKLHKEEIISVIKKGNTKLCKFTKKFTNSVYISENERLEDALTNSNLKVIHKEIQKVKSQAIILLFGSYAKGTQTKKSDIDLLIISDNTKSFEKAISWIPKKLHITSITYTDFDLMLKSKEFTVVSEAIKSNIIICGVEDYYRFIENAK